MSQPGKRTLIAQMPAWMGHPFFFIFFGALLVAGLYTFVSALVGFTTWFHVVMSAISVALFLWLFLLTLSVWRRETAH